MFSLFVLLFFAIVGASLETSSENTIFFRQNLELEEESDTCTPKFCSNTTLQSQYVINYCEKNNFTVNGRCCIINKTNSTLITGYRPKVCVCPGGNFSWSNMTDDYCIGRQDLCHSNFTNVNCTSNSECAENGPGNIVCNCKPGFHGYKCLQEGEFPTLEYTLIMCITTVVLSAVLWFTQRRHVIKKD